MLTVSSFVAAAALLSPYCSHALAMQQTEQPPYASHHPLRRTPAVQLDPVHPSVLRDAEGRNGGSHSAKGDYIMQGLSGIMNTVTREYVLRESESFYWGPSGNPIANLTAFADNKAVRVLSLERFDDVLENAQCDSSSVKLTFTREVQFDTVQTAWQWVNEADENYIVLITESAQCNMADGDETIRQPWHIINADFNDDTNVVTLSAEPKTWSEAFSNWRLTIRSKGLLSQQQNSARHALDKRLNIKFSPQIDLSQDFSNKTISLSDDSGDASASMTCTQCETHGTLDFDIDIIPHLCDDWFKCATFQWDPYLEGHISVVADSIGATVQIKTGVSGAASGFRGSEEIFKWEPPIGRIKIPGVLDIGPELKFLIAGDIGRVENRMELQTGIDLEIPDNAIYYIDVHDSSNNQVSDWTPSITPLDPTLSGTVSLSASIGGELHLDFAGEVMSIGAAELGILLAAPTFNMKASAFETTADTGACNNPEADFGVNLDVGVGMSLNAYEQAGLELLGDTVAHVGATQTIWSTSTALYTTCLTIAADESTATATATPVPSGAPYPYGNGTTWNAPYPTAYARKALRP